MRCEEQVNYWFEWAINWFKFNKSREHKWWIKKRGNRKWEKE
jgi:hypothetical protein